MTITAHSARIAGILKTLAAGAQILIVIAWFVMWKYLDMPFWTAAGYCLIAGVIVYTVVGAVASFLLTLARVQPITALFLHVRRLLFATLWGVLRLQFEMPLLKSAGICAGLYALSSFIVSMIERRARRKMQI